MSRLFKPTFTKSSMTPLERSLERIKELQALEASWNMYDAEKIPEAVIQRAISLVKKLNHQPAIFPTAQESVQFEFTPNGSYLEVEVFEDRYGIYEQLSELEEDLLEEAAVIEIIEAFFARQEEDKV